MRKAGARDIAQSEDSWWSLACRAEAIQNGAVDEIFTAEHREGTQTEAREAFLKKHENVIKRENIHEVMIDDDQQAYGD